MTTMGVEAYINSCYPTYTFQFLITGLFVGLIAIIIYLVSLFINVINSSSNIIEVSSGTPST